MDILNQDIKYLPGVGPNRKKMLSNELGIESYGDLLEYYPTNTSTARRCTPSTSLRATCHLYRW